MNGKKKDRLHPNIWGKHFEDTRRELELWKTGCTIDKYYWINDFSWRYRFSLEIAILQTRAELNERIKLMTVTIQAPEQVIVHPLVLLSVTDHYNRSAVRQEYQEASCWRSFRPTNWKSSQCCQQLCWYVLEYLITFRPLYLLAFGLLTGGILWYHSSLSLLPGLTQAKDG